MAIERNLFFANGCAYDIQGTMNFITNLYNMADEGLFPEARFEEIMSVLIDFKYLALVDRGTLIADVHDEHYDTVENWMQKYGIVDHRVDYYVEQLGNNYLNMAHFVNDLFQSPIEDFEPEECMEEDEEMEQAMMYLAESMGQTQDLDELYAYNHPGGMTEASLDSFLRDPDEDDVETVTSDLTEQ